VSDIVVRDLGLRRMPEVWDEMRRFTDTRDAATADEVWLLEHEPVFTLGTSGDRSHVLDAGDIPVIPTDRGGQVTYHGPGQLVCYVLLDLARRGLGVRSLVQALELAVIDTAAGYGIEAYARREAPGVYVAGRKLAAIGLRVRRGSSYHGIAVNVSMGLEPFARIDPCGYAGLEVTQIADFCDVGGIERFSADFVPRLLARLDRNCSERCRK
jgi:lipoyl(octanoyl) transferase